MSTSAEASHTTYEDQYFETIKKLETTPSSLLLRKKAAYLSLFLGKIDEAYHWSVSLNFFHDPSLQKIRQKRIELFKKNLTPDNDYRVTQGIFSLTENKNNKNPHEEAVWNSNPHREDLIKKILSWKSVNFYKYKIFSKTSIKKIKESIAPCSYEPGAAMDYPGDYKNFPNIIIGYWYYAGFIYHKEKTIPVIFRLPEYPSDDQEIDFFTEEDLSLDIQGGESIICYFSQKPETQDAWLECKLKIHSIFSQNNQQFGSKYAFYQGHEAWGLPGQRPTLERIKEYSLEKWIQPHHDILDIGCNIGCFGIEVSKISAQYTGFDINPDLIEIANTLALNKEIKNCNFLTTDFHSFIKNNDKKYDFIFSFAVHGWIGLPMKGYVEILQNLLNPNGFVLIESHDVTNDAELLKFFRNMPAFLEAKFSIIHQGILKDDNKRRRSFFIFQYNKNE